MVKKPPATAGDIRDLGSTPGSGRSPGGGHGNPLQYSCLENPRDRGACRLQSMGYSPKGQSIGYSLWATVHRVAESQIGLKQLSTKQRSLLSVLLLGLGKLSQWVLKIDDWLSIHLFMY